MATSKQYTNLKDSIDGGNCYCLNEHPNFTYKNTLMGDDRLILKSDADEQLIIHIEFRDSVKLHSLNISAPEDDTAPRLVKLYVNRNNLGFSDIMDIEPVQALEMNSESLKKDSVSELKFVKFQRVKSLTIFIEENNGADTTSISGLQFFGEAIIGTKMSELKKVTDD